MIMVLIFNEVFFLFTEELFKELGSLGSSENLVYNKKHLKHKLFFVINK